MGHLEHTEDEVMGDVFIQDDLSPTIAEHASQCRSIFHKYMVMPKIVPDPTVIDDQLARFTLWTSNMDVYGPLNVSLDYRLRFSPLAADIIHQLLDIVCDTLLSLKPIDDRLLQSPSRKRQRTSAHGGLGFRRRVDDDASDSESDIDPVEENTSKLNETIAGTLTRLFRLSNAVRKSAKANRARKIEKYRDDQEANQAIDELRLYTKCYIEFRFPNAPEWLLSALVEANALRLRRLYYQRSHRRRIELSVQSPEVAPPTVQLPKTKGSAPTIRFAPSTLPQPAKTTKMTSFPPVPATNASTARQTAVADFYARPATEAPRAKSVLVNNELSFPPPPPTKQCPYCGVIVEYQNHTKRSLWQKHVIGDLEPFVCVFPHCLEGIRHEHETDLLTFETSKAWSSHMQSAHGHMWECRAPSHDPLVFAQEIQYQEHSIKEHGVPEAHAGTLSNAARRAVLEKVVDCPFGDDFQPPKTVDFNAVFSSEALYSHVEGHMKEIALLTLQKLPSDEEESIENVDSDQPVVDDGPPGAVGITRASMDSILGEQGPTYQDSDIDDAPGEMGHRDKDITTQVTGLGLEDKDESGMTPLHHAVEVADLVHAELLILRGANMNARDEYGQTPLHYAAQRGFTNFIQLLAERGADLDILDSSGCSPILCAVLAEEKSTVMRLLALGASVDSSSSDGKSTLAWAANLNSSAVAALLVGRGASTSITRDTQQALPLDEAAASGNTPIIELLLQRGEDVNHRDRDGWSAIHWAAEEGHFEIVDRLLNAGANPNAVSSYGTSPLHCAANGGHISIVNLFLLRQDDPLKSTCHGWTALHHAAFMGHSHVVKRLLEDDRIRAAASQQDNHGWSVLHLAVHSRDISTVRILLDSSEITEPQTLFDESGLTAEEWLDREPTSRSEKMISDLAFSKSRCCRAVTGLRQAVSVRSIPMVKLLASTGHDINGMNSGRRTALYYAAKKHELPMMDLLLDLGANTNILPRGRRNWEDFIQSADVLQRLNRAGYQKRGPDPEVDRQIRQALKEQSRVFVPQRRPAWSAADTATLPAPDQPVSSGPVLSNQYIPEQQGNDSKRKAKSGRTEWWKRLGGLKS